MHLLVVVLSYFMITGATFVTTVRHAHHVTSQIVDDIDNTIVTSSFSADSWTNCAYECTRLSSVFSVYYNPTKAMCYCNNNVDEKAVTTTSGGGNSYSHMLNMYEEQSDADGYTRYVISGGYGSCAEIYNVGFRYSGVYLVQHLSPSPSTTEMYCELGTESWRMFQRRLDGSENFDRGWSDYINGFGSLHGEFWLGLETLHQITNSRTCELQIFLEAESSHTVQVTGYARYSTFYVGDANSNYALMVDGFYGDVGNSLGNGHNQMEFSTFDNDNDKYPGDNCAQKFKSGWWFNTCLSANLNGEYLAGNTASYKEGIQWYNPWGHFYSLLKTEMMVRCA